MGCRNASLKTDSPRQKAKLASSSTISAVEKIARSDPKHASSAEEWDADTWALNTPGGVVDLRTGRMREHRRDDRMTKISTATPKGDCPTWHGFLTDVTGGDADLIAYLQLMVGYCLTGITSEHALFFLYGNGIIAGHGRLAAARKLGLDQVPVIELAHLSSTQKRAYVMQP